MALYGDIILVAQSGNVTKIWEKDRHSILIPGKLIKNKEAKVYGCNQ